MGIDLAIPLIGTPSAPVQPPDLRPVLHRQHSASPASRLTGSRRGSVSGCRLDAVGFPASYRRQGLTVLSDIEPLLRILGRAGAPPTIAAMGPDSAHASAHLVS